MKLLAVLATCWLAAAAAILLDACWPAAFAGPDLFCVAAVAWACRGRDGCAWCGALAGLASDLHGSYFLGPGVAVLSLTGWLVGRRMAGRAVAAALAAGGAALALRLAVAAQVLAGPGMGAGWPTVAGEGIQTAIVTAAITWTLAWRMAGRRREVWRGI